MIHLHPLWQSSHLSSTQPSVVCITCCANLALTRPVICSGFGLATRIQIFRTLHLLRFIYTSVTSVNSWSYNHDSFTKDGYIQVTIPNIGFKKKKKKKKKSWHTLVEAEGLASSNFLFFLIGFLFPPVALLLCQLSREIPTNTGLKYLQRMSDKVGFGIDGCLQNKRFHG